MIDVEITTQVNEYINQRKFFRDIIPTRYLYEMTPLELLLHQMALRSCVKNRSG